MGLWDNVVKSQLPRLFKTVDERGDGKIEYPKFKELLNLARREQALAAAAAGPAGAGGPSATTPDENAFNAADVEKTGILDSAELKNALATVSQYDKSIPKTVDNTNIDEIMTMFDRVHSGKVDLNAFKAALSLLRSVKLDAASKALLFPTEKQTLEKRTLILINSIHI